MKTKKLKKLWSKYQTAQREIKDIQEEFQQERSDMLDTIRELTRQLKLKEVRLVPSARTETTLPLFQIRTCSDFFFRESVASGGSLDVERLDSAGFAAVK